MNNENRDLKPIAMYIKTELAQSLKSLSVALCGLSLLVIAIRLGPLTRQANTWNSCVQTTSNFLSTLPGFGTANVNDLKAMSVSLCNGSTPQKEEPMPPS